MVFAVFIVVPEEWARAYLGLSKKSVSWTSTFVTKVLQESERRSDVTFLVQTFWARAYFSTERFVAAG